MSASADITRAPRKPRAPNAFRQRDITKAVKAAFAAGAQSVTVQLGNVIVIANKSEHLHLAPAPPIGTGWEDVA